MRFRVLVLIATLVFGMPRAAVPQVTSWDAYMAAGAKAYLEGRYADAERSWAAALKQAEGFGAEDPRLATSLSNLGVLYRAQGRYAEAESLLPAGVDDSREGAGAGPPGCCQQPSQPRLSDGFLTTFDGRQFVI